MPRRPHVVAADGHIAANDVVGQRILEDWRMQQRVHRDAAQAALTSTATSTSTSTSTSAVEALYAFVNASRAANSERLLHPPSLSVLEPFAAELLQFAADPLGPLPPCFVPACTEAAPTGAAPTEEALRFYYRQVSFTPDELSQLVTAFMAAYPATTPRMTVLLEAVKVKEGVDKVWLRYAGQTLATTPSGRAVDDLAPGQQRLVSNFLNFAGITDTDIEVLQLDIDPIFIDLFEFRINDGLQAVERALISLPYPLVLNSARGGVRHIPAELPLVFSLPPPDDPENEAVRELVQRKNDAIMRDFDDAVRLWVEAGEMPQRISLEALNDIKEGRLVRRTWNGSVGNVVASKDITVEHFENRHVGLGYRGEFSGPGPMISHDMRFISRTGKSVTSTDSEAEVHVVLGPFVDLWSVVLFHRRTWLAIILIRRYILLLGARSIVLESSLVSTLVILAGVFVKVAEAPHFDDTLELVEYLESTYDLDLGVQHHHGRVADVSNSGWIDLVGHLVIVPLGDDKFVLASHGGRVKYDPAIAKQVERLLAAVVSLETLMEVMTIEHEARNGPPVTLAEFQQLHGAILQRAEDEGMMQRIESARKELREVSVWTNRRRTVGANRRAVNDAARANALSSTMSDIRKRAVEQNVKAIGAPHSDVRKTQVAQILGEDRERRAYGLDFLSHPLRPQTMVDDDTAWENWLLNRKAGKELVTAAGVTGTHAIATASPEERWQYAKKRFGASIEQRTEKARHFMNGYDAGETIIRQSTEGSFVSPDNRERSIQLTDCTSCNRSAIGPMQNLKHRCGVDMAYSKANLQRVPFVFAHEAFEHPTRFDGDMINTLIDGGVVESLDARDVLVELLDGGALQDHELAPIVRANIDTSSLEEPMEMLVAPGASVDWTVKSAIAVLLDAPGVPGPATPVTLRELRLVTSALQQDQPVCVSTCLRGCGWVSMGYSQVTHDCLGTDGAPSSGSKSAGPRPSSTHVDTAVAWQFADLPRDTKVALWASFVTTNRVHMSVELFAWHATRPVSTSSGRKRKGSTTEAPRRKHTTASKLSAPTTNPNALMTSAFAPATRPASTSVSAANDAGGSWNYPSARRRSGKPTAGLIAAAAAAANKPASRSSTSSPR